MGKLDDGTEIVLVGDPEQGFLVKAIQYKRREGLSVAVWGMADVGGLINLLETARAHARAEAMRHREVKEREARIRETGEDITGPGE